MSDIQINAEVFFHRLKRLVAHWKSNSEPWGGVNSVCITLGSREDETSYSKASALHLYLLGYEITDSIIIITENSFWFMASDKKCKYLETSLANKPGEIAFHSLYKTKDEGMNRENFNKLLGIARKCGQKLGFLQLELTGQFVKSWQNSLELSQLERIDITPAIGTLLSVKDDSEIVSSFDSISFIC